jgi:2-desacetyl-2-hydroxyethyl bacteriochlorophyllide A dehydrogenase
MKALVCVSPGKLEYDNQKDPQLEAGKAIIKIKRIGICGTDLHAFEGTQPFFTYPRRLGHELSGELVDFDQAPGFVRGEAVSFIPYFDCGVCVACRTGRPNCCTNLRVCGVHIDGGMAEFLSVPSSTMLHGENLSLDELALIEPLAIGAHAVRRAEVRAGEFVLVIGAGPIGLGIMEFARVAGATVIALELNAQRRTFCKDRLKMHHVLDSSSADHLEQIRAITNGDMPAVIMDATGNLNAINGGFRYMAHGGRYVLVGLQSGAISFSHPEFHKREGTLMSSRNATRKDFEHVMACVGSGEVKAKEFITHRVAFGDAASEFKNWLLPGSSVVKAMVNLS